MMLVLSYTRRDNYNMVTMGPIAFYYALSATRAPLSDKIEISRRLLAAAFRTVENNPTNVHTTLPNLAILTLCTRRPFRSDVAATRGDFARNECLVGNIKWFYRKINLKKHYVLIIYIYLHLRTYHCLISFLYFPLFTIIYKTSAKMHPWFIGTNIAIVSCFVSFSCFVCGKNTPYNPFLFLLKLHGALHWTEFHHNYQSTSKLDLAVVEYLLSTGLLNFL